MAVKSLAQSTIRQSPSVGSMLAGYEGNQFHHLETVRLGGNAAFVEFTNLARYADYQHLQVRMTMRSDRPQAANDTIYFRLNGDTATNYSVHILYGNGSSPVSAAGVTFTGGYIHETVPSSGTGGVAGNYAGAVLDLLDPFETTKFKTARSLAGSTTTSNWIVLSSSHWRSTNAVDSIRFYSTTSNNLVAGSRFSLYGLKARA